MERIEFFKNFIVESDLIENIRDDAALVEKELRENKKDGHVGAILFLEELAENKKYLLRETDIKRVQQLIIEEQQKKRPGLTTLKKEWIGNYRNVSVRVGDRICPDHQEVPHSMQKLILAINKWQQKWRKTPELLKKLCIALIADFHYEFEMLHPFVDGNGRTGRAIALYLMLHLDVKPFIFTSHDKFEYYLAFQLRNKEIMRAYFYEKGGNG